MNQPRIFVSSTCKDLAAHRERIIERIRGLGYQPIYSEDSSFPVNPSILSVENCYNNVENFADVLILIIGNRYGSIDINGKSVTENEYRRAVQIGIPVLVFVDQKTIDYLPVVEKNAEINLDGLFDSRKIFDFLKSIMEVDKKWVFKYNNLSEIENAIVAQLAGLFCKTLSEYQKIHKVASQDILNILDSASKKVFLEKGDLWEFDLLTCLLKEFYRGLRFKEIACDYSYAENPLITFASSADLANISKVFNSDKFQLITRNLGILVNKTILKAVGDPGKPGDPEMIIFVAREVSNCYGLFLIEYIEISKYLENDLIGNLARCYLDMVKPMVDFLKGFPTEWELKVNAIRKAISENKKELTLAFVFPAGPSEPFQIELDRLVDIHFH